MDPHTQTYAEPYRILFVTRKAEPARSGAEPEVLRPRKALFAFFAAENLWWQHLAGGAGQHEKRRRLV
nr:hypothetical protein [Ectobacillus panaciterrae]